MGCFSFICKKSGKPALSTSFDGSPCHMFLLKNGKVIEEMFGNYDSYGRVFNNVGESFKWSTPWKGVCKLMFSKDKSNGIALVLTDTPITGTIPSTRSKDDPDQGWGSDYEFIGNTDNDVFLLIKKPFHKVHHVDKEQPEDVAI